MNDLDRLSRLADEADRAYRRARAITLLIVLPFGLLAILCSCAKTAATFAKLT